MAKHIEPPRRASQSRRRRATAAGDAGPPTADSATRAERIWQVVAMIPAGSVATYGQVAELAGLPRGARLVGNTLGKLPNGSKLPWHRVLNSKGELSFPRNTARWRRQRDLLREDGVELLKGRLNLRHYRWQP